MSFPKCRSTGHHCQESGPFKVMYGHPSAWAAITILDLIKDYSTTTPPLLLPFTSPIYPDMVYRSKGGCGSVVEKLFICRWYLLVLSLSFVFSVCTTNCQHLLCSKCLQIWYHIVRKMLADRPNAFTLKHWFTISTVRWGPSTFRARLM